MSNVYLTELLKGYTEDYSEKVKLNPLFGIYPPHYTSKK